MFDVVVVGGGPGGYIAAVRAAQLGLEVACIDAWKNAQGKPSLGGTCLNVGCIPSKALLESSENYERALHRFGDHGIQIDGVRIDVGAMLKRKDKIVEQFTGGVAYLFKKNKVKSIHGRGRFVGREGEAFALEAVDGDQVTPVLARQVIIATGSVPRAIPAAAVDNVDVLDNTGALALGAVPARLGVIGAGVIGLEMGSVWRRLGSEVTLLEALDGFLMAADAQVAKEAHKIFTREQGLRIELGARVTGVDKHPGGLTVHYEQAGAAHAIEVDKLVVAVGRAPCTEGLQLDRVGLAVDARGLVPVDDDCATQVPGIWAVGDVVRGPMLAHKAEDEGAAVAERIAGQHPHIDYNCIPWVIYTHPEVAWVGETEQALKARGADYRTGTFPFAANGRARSLGEQAGFVKILADRATDRILGVHIVGPWASELVTEAVVAMEFSATSEDIARIVHAHPSLGEVFREAALAVDGRALNM